MLKTFKGGVKLNYNKELTNKQNIQILPPPKMVKITIKSGYDCVVKTTNKVKKGEIIAKPKDIGCNIFASVSGTIKSISNQTITIENDFLNLDAHLKPLNNPTSDEIIERVNNCGVCGLGGGGFPTALKLKVNNEIDQLIINGAECETYITCDHRIMLEYTAKFIKGVLLIKQALNAKKVIIGIESNKQDASVIINDYITQNKIEDIVVTLLKVKYPQGSDKQLIDSLTKKKIPKGERSYSHKVVVVNVHTALSVYLAVYEGKQNYSRVLTVSGQGIKTPKNLWVPVGTSYSDIIDFCDGLSDKPTVKLLNGGTMMGQALKDTNQHTDILTSAILFLTANECELTKASACINCKKCASVCPMKLMPMYIDSLSNAKLYPETIKYGLNFCIECGCCSFICPAKRDILSSIKLAKQELLGAKNNE